MNQIIVTGIKLNSEQATKIRIFCELNNLFAIDWCHPDGSVGYLDSATKVVNEKILKQDLLLLVKSYPNIEIGVTLMNGSPGKANLPVVQFLISNGKVIKTDSPHFGHGPPKRYQLNKQS